MKNIFNVLKFTAYELLIKKSFLVTNIFMLILIVAATNIPNIIDYFDDDKLPRILIVDNEKVYGDYLSSLESMELEAEIEVIDKVISSEKLEDYIDEEKYELILSVNQDNQNIEFSYLTEEVYLGEFNFLEPILENAYTNIKISELDLTDEQALSISPVFSSEYTSLKENNLYNSANYAIAMFLSVALFYAIYFYAFSVSSSVTTEKTSKIVEILLTSTDSKSVIIGKILGIGLVGFTQIIFFILFGLGCTKIFMDSSIVSDILSNVNLSPLFILITLIYFVFGYLLYSFVFALTGATVNRVEDIQTANTPGSLLAVISFYLAIFTMTNPGGFLSNLAKYFPFSSPFIMPTNYINGSVGIIELLISIAILIVSVIIISFISIKVYRSAILNYGSKVDIKKYFKRVLKK